MSYGVVITQDGIDISNAQDFQKSLDSRWKSLDVAVEVDIDFYTPVFGAKTGNIVFELYRHNLNKLAPFEFMPSVKSGGNPDMFNGVLLQQQVSGGLNAISITLSWFSGQSTNAVHILGKLRVYDLDLAQTFMAPPPDTSVPGGSNVNEVGARFLDQQKGSRDINSSDLDDFTLNTSAKAINIQTYGLQRAVSGLLPITHGVGYPPTYMLCLVTENSDGTRTLGALTYAPGIFITATNTTITFKGVQTSLGTNLYGYIILKDPVDIAS